MLSFAPTTLLPTRARVLTSPVCPARRPARVATRMVLSDKEAKVRPIRITGNNVQITESLRAYINDKLAKVIRRYGPVVTKMDVHLTVEHNPSIANPHKAEVVAYSGKTILRTEVRSTDMYASIDAVEERIARTIRKFKERRETKGGKSKNNVQVADIAAPVDDLEEETEDEFADVYQEPAPGVPAVTEVVKRKVFPMPLQTVEEAVLCCEYVDHPWYLFRNAETKEISLVYKRNHGGYGLIEPGNPDIVDEEPL